MAAPIANRRAVFSFDSSTPHAASLQTDSSTGRLAVAAYENCPLRSSAAALLQLLLELAHPLTQSLELPWGRCRAGGCKRRRWQRAEELDVVRIDHDHLDVIAEAVHLTARDDGGAVVVRPGYQPSAHEQDAHVAPLRIEVEADRRSVVLRHRHR